MSKAFKALAKSLIAAVLFSTRVGYDLTPGTERFDTSSRDRQRLARFEKQVDDFRTVLKIPGMSVAIIKIKSCYGLKASVSQI